MTMRQQHRGAYHITPCLKVGVICQHPKVEADLPRLGQGDLQHSADLPELFAGCHCPSDVHRSAGPKLKACTQ